MAIDLFCYSSFLLPQVKKALSALPIQYQDLFTNQFLISEAMPLTDAEKEIALEHGLNAQCLFLIHVNDKQAIGSLPAVVAIVKNSLGDANVVILFENEYRQ
jgi:hypothetical protein